LSGFLHEAIELGVLERGVVGGEDRACLREPGVERRGLAAERLWIGNGRGIRAGSGLGRTTGKIAKLIVIRKCYTRAMARFHGG